MLLRQIWLGKAHSLLHHEVFCTLEFDLTSCDDKSMNAKIKFKDASYLHRQINVILMQIYTKSGRLLTFSSFFLLLK